MRRAPTYVALEKVAAGSCWSEGGSITQEPAVAYALEEDDA